ncbi:MAG: membrane protein insertase YidC [Flavobacteriaceae bacterium]
MEEKKFDPYQFIGFILIALILTWMLYRNTPTENITSVNSTEQPSSSPTMNIPQSKIDSLQQQQRAIAYGDFGALFTPSESEESVLETEEFKMIFQPKGGQLKMLQLKEYENYEDIPLHMIDENNTTLFVEFSTRDGRILNTREMNFTPQWEDRGEAYRVTMKSSLSTNQYIAFIYEIPKDGFLFSMRFETQGFEGILNTALPATLHWSTDVFRNSRSIDYENRYTELTFGYDGDRVDYLSLSGEDQETRDNLRWISFRQHFFSAILIPNSVRKGVSLKSKDLSGDMALEERFTKSFSTSFEVNRLGDNLSDSFQFYYGPTDYKTLKALDGDLENSISLGWGIFGWINRVIFLPLFAFLSSYFSYGIAIIVMTFIVRIAMSPVTYKAYVSQIKMKVLRPDIEIINNQHKDDAVRRQQETMSLYSKAGVNPMSGCIPALIQLPVFYALFSFFPVAFVLRDKAFLWADDLSSYDSVLDLGFTIPFYGDHVSLFPILASVAIFFYTKMTTGQQPMPQQPGMPNMKIIIYLMPVMMLFFFNNYASGLSLYYFVSNLLTIFLMLIIKNFIIDDEKIHAKIEANKLKPKKTGGFSARLQKAMEEADKQRKAGNRKR